MSEWRSACALCAAFAAPACAPSSPPVAPAPSSGAITIAPPSASRKAESPHAGALELRVVRAESRATLLMEAPLERISGIARNALDGKVLVDPTDLAGCRGVIRVDLDALVLERAHRTDPRESFSQPSLNEKQNEHMRTWLEIGADAPEPERSRNRYAELTIERLEAPVPARIEAPDARVELQATAVTRLRLHGREVPKRIEIRAELEFWGGRLLSAHVVSREPFEIHLAEHDIAPREAFGKLAMKALEELSNKVAPAAKIDIELFVESEQR